MVNNTERYQSSDFNSYFCIPWWYWYTLYIKIVQWLPISLWKLHYHPFVIILRACVVAAWLILLACSLLRSSDGSGVSSDLPSFTPFLRTPILFQSQPTPQSFPAWQYFKLIINSHDILCVILIFPLIWSNFLLFSFIAFFKGLFCVVWGRKCYYIYLPSAGR